MYFEHILVRSFKIPPRRASDALQSCLDSILAGFGELLDASWTPLGRLLGDLGRSWLPLGRFLADLGRVLSHLGAILSSHMASRLDFTAISIQFQIDFAQKFDLNVSPSP